MKKLLIFIYLIISITANATNYYIKTGGSDAANGLSDANAWATITKVNSVWAAGTFAPGDSILFKRGNTFTGVLTAGESGTSGGRIIVGAYSTSANPKPIITGFTTVTGWTNYGGGIYSKAVTTGSRPDLVLLDGVNQQIARWPKTGWYLMDSSPVGSETEFTASELNVSSLVGAEVVQRNSECLIDRGIIQTHSGTTITFSPGTTDPIRTNGWGYFIQNKLSFLTAYGDWCYVGGTFYMYFGAVNPTTKTVKVVSSENALVINGKSYITIDNIDFQGTNADCILLTNATYITIQYCNISNNGRNGIRATVGSYIVIDNNTLINNNNTAIDVSTSWATSHVTVSNNSISYSGSIEGLGQNSFDSYCGILNWGNYSLTTYNRIEYTGYCAIKWGGLDAEISYNYINEFCLTKEDGGAMYNYRDYNTGKVIKYNVILNGTGQSTGGDPSYQEGVEGIYLDGTYNTTITYNTIGHLRKGFGIYLNSGNTNIAEYNTTYDCLTGLRAISEPGVGQAYNHRVRYNTFFAVYAGDYGDDPKRQCTLELNSYRPVGETDIANFGVFDYNYFARPLIGSAGDHYINYITDNQYTRYYVNLVEWRAAYGHDIHSTVISGTTNDINDFHFAYNDSTVAKNFTLSATMYEVDSTEHLAGTITLQPFTSMILVGVGTFEEVGGGGGTQPTTPMVTTITASQIGSTSAIAGGNVTSDGGATVTARGVCWGIATAPTTAGSKTTNGTGTGAFSSSITGLTKNTTYYYRAYATNSEGTVYGSEHTFKTVNNLIVVW